MSLMFAFIGEPMMDYLGLTVHDKWKHLYSVPIYYVLYLVSFYGGLILSKNGKATFHNSNHDIDKHEEKLSNDMYHYAFEHSFNSIYVIEKKNQDKDFRFTQVNDHFCNELGYTKEEMLSLDPRLISDQKSYNVDIKYRPLLLKGNMEIDTVLLKKSGEKKYVNLKVKVFRRKDKIEILSIANFLENKVTDFEAN